MTNNRNQLRLCAGTLALVLVAGLASPAFADTTAANDAPPTVVPQKFFLPSGADPEDIVYENGVTDPNNGRFIDFVVVADDFVLGEADSITDVHFVMGDTTDPFGFPGPFAYEIRTDASGSPGSIISSGFSTNLEQEKIADAPFGEPAQRWLTWFDFEEPIPLEGGVTYWLVLHAGPFDELGFTGAYWEMSNPSLIGNPAHIHLGDGNFLPTTFDNWFQITAKDVVVGGEFLPIDSTALILAGAQTNAIWIMSALAVIGSVAFGALYITSKRN